MSEPEAILDVDRGVEWRDSSSSRTRPVQSGQYPSSSSPRRLDSPVNVSNLPTSRSNNNNKSSMSCKSLPPLSILPTSKAHVNEVNHNSEKDGCAGSASVDKLQVRICEPKNISVLPSKNSRHRKEAGIPVGIAVAWQRLVTSSSSSTINTNSTTVACSDRSISPLDKPSKVKSSNLLSPNLPKRPLLSASAPGAIPMKDTGEKSKSAGSKVPDIKSRPASVNSLPISPCIPAVQPSSSTYMDQQYAFSGLNRPYTDWQTNMLHLPQNYGAATAGYLQQQHHLSVQQQHTQLQLTHGGPYGTQLNHSYLYHGYSPEAVQKYEQYLHQSEYHRHQQELHYHNQLHQHHLQQEFDIHRATPVPSPRINIPSPSPTIHSHSFWPPELFHHNSSTTLSPKSLTSTPSPVTVQDASNFLLTPTPAKSNGAPVNLTVANKNYQFSSPFSPPGLPSKVVPKEPSKINPVPKKVKKCEKIDSPTLDITKLEEEAIEDRGTILFKKKHDFKRLESLIEKRDEISVPLLNPCPENSSSNSTGEKCFPEKIEALLPKENIQQSEIKTDVNSCDVVVDGGSKQVPDDTEHSYLPFTNSKIETCLKDQNDYKTDSAISEKETNDFNYSSKLKVDSGSREKLKKTKATLKVKEEKKCSSYFKPIESKCSYSGSVDLSSSSASDNDNVDLSLGSPLSTDVKPPIDINATNKIKREDNFEPMVQGGNSGFHGTHSVLLKETAAVSESPALTAEFQSATISTLISAPIHELKPFSPVVNIKMESHSIQSGNSHVPVISKCTEDEAVYLNRNLEPTVKSDSLATKCDNDIKVETTRYSSYSNSSFIDVTLNVTDNTSTSLDFSQPDVDTASQHQAEIKEYQQHQLTGNRNYHLLNVPLPSLSVDRKFNFKSESCSASDTIGKDHNILVHRLHHHNFLPIEEGNNHLDLLATVAQEFGNEIGLRKKPHLHTLDTYEFREEADEKIESFGQSHSVVGNFRSASAPISKPIREALSPPLTMTPVPIPVPSVVLKIPQITPMAGERITKKCKSAKTEKTVRKRKEKIAVLTEENADVKQIQKKKYRTKSAEELKSGSTPRSETMKPKIKAISNVSATPVQEKPKAMKKSKKQNTNIKDNVKDPDSDSKELKVLPLNLKKRRSTTDAIVMRNCNKKRSNSLSSCEYEIVRQPLKGGHSLQFSFSSQVQKPNERIVANEKSKSTFAKSSNFNSKNTSTNLISGLEEGQSKKSRKKQNQPLQKPNALSQDLRMQNNKKQKPKKEKLPVKDFTLNAKIDITNSLSSNQDTVVLSENNVNSTAMTGSDKTNIVITAADETARFHMEDSPILFSPASSNAENDWATNPTHAVTAIKTDSESSSTSTSFSILSSCNTTVSPDASFDKMDTDSRKSAKPSKLALMNSNCMYTNESQSQSPPHENKIEKTKVKFQLKSSVRSAARRVSQENNHHVKPCLKAEPIIRQTAISPEEDDFIVPSEDEEKDSNKGNEGRNAGENESFGRVNSSPPRDDVQEKNADIIVEENIPSDEIMSAPPDNVVAEVADDQEEPCEMQQPEKSLEKVVIEDVSEMLDDMRILTEIQGLFYTGKLNALQPPDVYGVTLDNERGAPPHLIFSAEEVLEKCIREIRPDKLDHGLRICAYWSPQYSGLYPGKISQDYAPSSDPHVDLIPIEFDDGDTGVIKLNEIRLLASNHPIRAYDPNPLLTLEKKHRKRRHSSATGSQSGCNGDHEDADCGEPYCAKIAKLEETPVKDKHSSRLLYWTWKGLGHKKPRSKKDRNKEFFDGIQRGDEIINVGDSALFISNGNDRPFIGRVEKFWEKKGQKVVHVRWFYHPDEVKTGKRPQGLYTGALFESPHIDENDVQTIAKKCQVLPFDGFKEKVGCLTKWSKQTSQREIYYIAGFYDPYTYNLQLKDLK